LRKLLVGEDKVEVLVPQELERGFAARQGADLVAFGLDDAQERTQKDRVVLHDQDPVLHSALLWRRSCQIRAGAPDLRCRPAARFSDASPPGSKGCRVSDRVATPDGSGGGTRFPRAAGAALLGYDGLLCEVEVWHGRCTGPGRQEGRPETVLMRARRT